jgi:hypothetical protein
MGPLHFRLNNIYVLLVYVKGPDDTFGEHMTVQELMSMLSSLPGDLEVVTESGGSYGDIVSHAAVSEWAAEWDGKQFVGIPDGAKAVTIYSDGGSKFSMHPDIVAEGMEGNMPPATASRSGNRWEDLVGPVSPFGKKK